jgi:hypothetical protein
MMYRYSTGTSLTQCGMLYYVQTISKHHRDEHQSFMFKLQNCTMSRWDQNEFCFCVAGVIISVRAVSLIVLELNRNTDS